MEIYWNTTADIRTDGTKRRETIKLNQRQNQSILRPFFIPSPNDHSQILDVHIGKVRKTRIERTISMHTCTFVRVFACSSHQWSSDNLCGNWIFLTFILLIFFFHLFFQHLLKYPIYLQCRINTTCVFNFCYLFSFLFLSLFNFEKFQAAKIGIRTSVLICFQLREE